MNRHALALAREVAQEGNALLAGNICNTWAYDPDRTAASRAVVRAMYREQVAWALDEGADFVIAETNDYLGEALIAVEAVKEAGLPVIATFASTESASIDGVAFDEACKALEAAGADVVGLNCSRGPATMLPLLESIRAAVGCHLAAQPVPYRTTLAAPTFHSLRDAEGARAFPLGLDPFTCTRAETARFACDARDLGVYIGLCCGAAAHHVRAMAEALGRQVPSSRYSPDLSLHPVLGEDAGANEQRFPSWLG